MSKCLDRHVASFASAKKQQESSQLPPGLKCAACGHSRIWHPGEVARGYANQYAAECANLSCTGDLSDENCAQRCAAFEVPAEGSSP